MMRPLVSAVALPSNTLRRFIMQQKYKVDLNSVLGCQLEDFDHEVICEDFGTAKECAIDAFERVIDRLMYLCEQIKAVDSLEALDIGWWQPLFQRIDGDDQPVEEH
jgi:hypothetical protein